MKRRLQVNSRCTRVWSSRSWRIALRLLRCGRWHAAAQSPGQPGEAVQPGHAPLRFHSCRFVKGCELKYRFDGLWLLCRLVHS